MSLQVGKDVFGQKPKLSGTKRSKVDEVIRPVVPLKYAEVPNRANQLTLTFKGLCVASHKPLKVTLILLGCFSTFRLRLSTYGAQEGAIVVAEHSSFFTLH